MARRIRRTAIAVTAALVGSLVIAAPAPAERSPVRAEFRVNQQGWLPREPKIVALMTSQPLGPTTFTVRDRHGDVVLRGAVPSSTAGGWSDRFPDVYLIDLSALHAEGRYVVRTAG